MQVSGRLTLWVVMLLKAFFSLHPRLLLLLVLPFLLLPTQTAYRIVAVQESESGGEKEVYFLHNGYARLIPDQETYEILGYR